MKILAIDPGTRFTGFAIVNLSPFKPLEIGVIKTLDGPLEEKFAKIFECLHHLIDKYKISEVVVEKVFFSKDPLSALKLGMARGVVYLAAGTKKIPVSEISPNEVKKITTGKGHASKDEVANSLKILTGIKDFPKVDASDALAIAYAYSSKNFSKRSRSGLQI